MRLFLIQRISLFLIIFSFPCISFASEVKTDTLKLTSVAFPATDPEYPELDQNNFINSGQQGFRIGAIPINDNCLNAIQLNVNGPCINGTNRESTTETGEIYGCQGAVMRKSVWYYFIASSSKMFVEVEKTASYSCFLGSAVWEYGCLPSGSPLSCEDAANGPNLNIHRLNALIPGQRYMVQVTYPTSAICGAATNVLSGADFCIRVGETVDCSLCSSPCGSVCSFSSIPTALQVQSQCSGYNLNSRMNTGDSRTQCFSLTAPSSTINLQMIVNSYGCSSGNVTAFNWTIRSVSCGSIIDSGTLTKLSASGLSPGMGYVLCYTWTAACQHNSVYPYFTFVQPLPVDLISFQANASESEIKLDWITASELNNDRFVIERSKDAMNYETLGSVKGQSFASSSTSYQYLDPSPSKGVNYYRLLQIDHDGNSRYYGPIAERFSSKPFVSIHPNPADDILLIDLKYFDSGSFYYTIQNITGTVLVERSIQTLKENHVVNIDLKDLASGFYIIRIQSEHFSVSERFIKK